MELGVGGGSADGSGWRKVYRARVHARNRSMYASVEAFNQAVSRIYADFTHDLRDH
jgi:hypothetical protein